MSFSSGLVNSSPELILGILEIFTLPLGFPTDHLPNRTALLSCSLVCQRWSTQSQRLLFRRVIIDDLWASNMYLMPGQRRTRTINRITSFLDTITADTDKARWLRESVLSIVLRPHSSAKPSDTLAILTKLPNLRELDILGVACFFTDAQLSQLRNEGPRIQSLRVNSDHAGPITSMGAQAWPAVLKLIKAIPTLRMLDVTANTFQTFPAMPELEGPLGLRLLSFKFSSKWIADTSPFLSSLVGGRTGDDVEPLQLYAQMESQTSADLRAVLSTHGRHLRSLVVQGPLKDPGVLSLCTNLERFECAILPSEELAAAIPRSIKALAVTNPPPAPFRPQPVSVSSKSMEYLTQQLGTFPRLRVFTWRGSTNHPEFDALRECSESLGIEFRTQAFDSSNMALALSDDEVQFTLRRRLLQI